MVDHCHSKKFGKHFLKFMDKVKLQLQLILQLSIDGPNVNLRSEECLNASLEMKNINTSILLIGTCPLRIVHSAFRTRVNELNFSIDSLFCYFGIGSFAFFQTFSCKESRLPEMVEFTEVISHFTKKHPTTR